jgi:hypothetical protein
MDKPWVDADLLRAKTAMRKYIPTFVFPESNPCLSDRPGSGWSPSLGSTGCSIGLYKAEEEDLKEDARIIKWYIVCHSGLPDTTMQALDIHDAKVDKRNKDRLGYYVDIQEGLENSRLKSTGESGKGLTTFSTHLSSNSVHDRMRKVSIENARRLIYITSILIKLPLKVPPRLYQHRPGCDRVDKSSAMDLMKEGGRFRCPVDPGPFMEGDAKMIPTIVRILKARVPGTPILSSYCLPKHEYQGPLDPDPEMHGYPLGAILLKLKDDRRPAFDEIKLKGHFTLIDTPMTITEDILTEYNTFRNTRYQDTQWYSNCTPIQDISKGALCSRGLMLGYRVYRSALNEGSTEWRKDRIKNRAGDSFPVVFPFIPNDKRVIKDEEKAIFFQSVLGERCRQLFGKTDVRGNEMKDARQRLGTENVPTSTLLPVRVLLSRGRVSDLTEYV